MNLYDNIKLDIEKLFEDQNRKLAKRKYEEYTKSIPIFGKPYFIFKQFVHGFLFKTGIWKRLVYSNLELSWFYEFRK